MDLLADETILDSFDQSSENIIIPEIITISSKPLKIAGIGEALFKGVIGIKSVQIPNTVRIIGPHSFAESTLETISFQKNSRLERLEHRAFSKSAITAIVIPETVTILSNSVFESCTRLTTVEFPRNSQLTTIESSCFKHCSSLQRFECPSSVDCIGCFCFAMCSSLVSFQLTPSSKLSSFSAGMLTQTSLTEIFIPKSVRVLEPACLADIKSLRSVSFQEESECESIRTTAFKNTGIRKIMVPKSIDYIETLAFEDCTDLRTFIAHDDSNLEIMDADVFRGCIALRIIVPNCKFISKCVLEGAIQANEITCGRDIDGRIEQASMRVNVTEKQLKSDRFFLSLCNL